MTFQIADADLCRILDRGIAWQYDCVSMVLREAIPMVAEAPAMVEAVEDYRQDDMFGWDDEGHDWLEEYREQDYQYDRGRSFFHRAEALDGTECEAFVEGWEDEAAKACADAIAMVDLREAIADATSIAIECACANRRRYIPFT